MGDRGRSRKREARRIWKQRLSAVIAIVLVVSMVLNTPLSIRGLGFGISSVYASASNAGYSENGWATASNAEYKKGESQEVDIYVIAEDNDISAGNMAGMTLYLKNNTEEEITNGTLTFKGNHINKEDGYFTDISEGAAPDNGAEEEISGEDLLYEESRAAVLANGGQPSTGGESDDSGRAASGQTEEEENDALEEREAADFEADFGLDEEEENQHVLTGLTLAPGQLYEVYFEFYTEEDEEAAKASVSFKFKGEQADRKIRSEERFAYSIGLPYVSVNLEGGALVETGVEEEMNIWMNEPGWTTLEEEDAEEEETATRPNAGRGEYATKSGADRAEASTATKPNADRAEEEKIDKYTSEAMKIEDAKVSYKVEVFGTSFRKFKPKKAEEAADIGWISCVYEMARDAKPGVYYGKVTADGTWNRKKFITSQGFLFEVTGEGTVNLDAELNGTRVEVTGPASSFPEADKLELEVSELNEEEKTAVDLALEEGTTPYAMFTLNLLADGEATDLEGPVTVKMSNDIIAENTKTVVEEAAKEEAEEEALEAAALAAEAEAKSETETAPVAEAEAEDAPVNELSADSEPETLSESQIRKGPGMLKAAKAPAVSHLTADGSLDVEKKKEEDVEEVILADSESVGLTLLRVDTVSAQTEKTASGVTRKGALQAETDAIPAAYVLTGVGAIMPTADYDAKTTVTVTKKWVGGEDEEHKPVTIRLYRDGTAIGSSAILSGDSNWTYTFKDLDVFDEGWQKNIYTVKEDDVEGYRSSYDYKDNKFTGDAESRYTLTKADVPPFDANNQYILKTGENALSARWNDVNQNALTADANGLYTVDESMFWSVESNKDGTYYLKNNSSSYLYWKTGYDSGWSFARRSTSATKFSYDSESGVLSFKYNDRIKYLSTDNRGSISSSFDKDSALNIEFYIAELDEENGIEVTITNTKIPEGGGVDSTISYSKKIDYLGDNPGVNPDGNNDYRLYLDAAGQTQKGLDIVLVLDSSGSMDNNNRMRDLNTVLTEDGGILDSLLSNPQNKVSVVYFANQSELTQDWIDGAGAKEIVEKNLKTDGDGGTNYSAGLIKAVQQLNAVKDDGNEKCLIFMSDGKPTYYATKNKSQVSADNLDFSGNTAYGYGGDGGKYESINAAYATAFYNYCMTNNLIGADNIYTIAFGVPQGTDAENAAKVLKNMTGNKEGHYLSSENGTEALKNAFKGVLEAMGPHDISITDKLSEYVDYAGNWAVDIYVGDNKKAPTLTESDFNNRDSSAWNDYWKKVFTVNGTVPEGVGVSVDNTKKTITLTMPSSYKIPVGSRIVLSFDVTASQTASSKYLQNKTYNAKGDIETDADAYGKITSSLQAGFKSNTEATLTYNFGTNESDKETAKYAHPVIQVHPGNVLMLEKKLLDGDAESSVAKVEFKLYQISEDGSKWDAGKRPSEPYDTQFVVANADDTNTGKVTYTKLPVGCYELVETQTDPAYELLSQPIRIRVESQADKTLKYYVNDLNKENVEKEVSADKTDSNIHLYQSIANKRKQLTIQVVKRVKGNMSSPNDKFDFSYKTSENGKGIPLDKISAADTDGTTFTVPYGSYICVTESPDQYGYTKTEYQYQVGANEKVPGDGRICEIDKVTGNTTITFINTKQLTNPTGIFTNNTPYLWMLILAALGTLGIIYASYLRKRRRIHLKG